MQELNKYHDSDDAQWNAWFLGRTPRTGTDPFKPATEQPLTPLLLPPPPPPIPTPVSCLVVSTSKIVTSRLYLVMYTATSSHFKKPH
jgi:hypothetical protein